MMLLKSFSADFTLSRFPCSAILASEGVGATPGFSKLSVGALRKKKNSGLLSTITRDWWRKIFAPRSIFDLTVTGHMSNFGKILVCPT